MLEWVLLGVTAWLVYIAQKEKKRPVKRHIHCDVEVVESDRFVEVIVDNRYGVMVTASFDWRIVHHLAPEEQLPLERVIPGATTVCVARLWKTAPGHQISVDYHWVWGSLTAHHDPDCIYHLPFASGKTFGVSQGPGGEFSHSGESFHAVDFDMPIGTPVLAARAGVVVDTEDDFRYAALGKEIGGNYVFVQHEDDTVAEYFHLKAGGVAVKPGTVVEVGDLLGYSGNSGYSGGPHLHFMVFKAKSGRLRESLPLRFAVAGANAPLSLEQGRRYTAL
ncbi:MAG: M23 family metallopeptidase [Vulcanimicrobiota bacterium]